MAVSLQQTIRNKLIWNEALEVAVGVTWTIEKRDSTWEGVFCGPDSDQVQLVRKKLVQDKGWRPRDTSEFEIVEDQ